MAASENGTHLPNPDRRLSADNLIMVVLIFLLGLTVLLSLDFTTNPPTIHPWILLPGILVVAIIWIVRYESRLGVRSCPSCGRAIPGWSVFCPLCGQRLP